MLLLLLLYYYCGATTLLVIPRFTREKGYVYKAINRERGNSCLPKVKEAFLFFIFYFLLLLLFIYLYFFPCQPPPIRFCYPPIANL